VLFELAVRGPDIVHREGGVGNAVGDQRVLEGLRGRVLVWLKKQLNTVSGVGLGNRKPAVGVKGEGLFLVVD
jgi:hypothetical protein